MSSTPPSTPPSLSSSPTTPTTTSITPTNNTLSDIFSSSPPPTPHAPTEPSDLPRLRSTHITAGYRTGISISKPRSLQPGFDSGYSLGACFGLRIGTLIGLLEGLWACGGDERERERVGKLVRRAREELAVERVFGREYWGEEGGWRYEVVGEGEEVTWMEVVGGHPVVGEWEGRVRGEVERGGVRRGVFEGEGWEGGRVGE